ncbi:MAG TPA: MFS transporter [Verrucomicrobiae bacterium]|nr:MFS transporter [Verrucomicrobiae bacterium]
MNQSSKPSGQTEEGHFHWQGKHVVPAEARVSTWRKAAYGFGGLTDFFFLNLILGLAMPIYTIGLKMDPALLGIALAIPRVVGAVADTIVGPRSDNSHSTWGRRRPYILLGGLAGGCLLPLMWCSPSHSQWGMFVWVTGMVSIFSIAYSVFTIPYNALGYELSTDYDERTRVLAWRGYFQLFGTLASAWFYWFCLRPVFGNEVVGARWLSVLIGAIMIGGTLWTFARCRERRLERRQPSIPIGQALKLTIKNRPFLLLQGGQQMLALGMGITGALGTYVHIYYVCSGSKQTASWLSGWGGSLTIFTSMAAISFGVWLSRRLGKREACLVAIGIVLSSICLLPFLLTPKHPSLSVVAWLIAALGMPCCSLMFSSMIADVCDEDELTTNLRREGAYSAVNSVANRVMQIGLVLIGGFLPRLVGYVNPSAPLTPELLERMKWLLIGVQFVTVCAAAAILWFFPISRARAEKTRQILDGRKNQTRLADAAAFSIKNESAVSAT